MLGFWCFNAGVGFKQISKLEPRSIILTSGTLSPLVNFEAELEIEFHHKLESPHVINQEQVQISILRRSANNIEFNFSYQNKDNMDMIDELGYTVCRVAQKVPGGLLMFFPSYWLMNSTYERWKKQGILDQIGEYKPVFYEPQKAS